jgi:hypothetical protein
MAKVAETVFEVYAPSKPGLPFLAVAIYPSGIVDGVTADSATGAQAILKRLATELEESRDEDN